jgi:hypothetical protein
MRLTVPHYYDFGPDRDLLGGDLLGPEEWDSLRIEGRGIFRFPEDPREYERLVAESDWQERRARALAGWLAELGVGTVASYGVGPGIVEAWLLRLVPDVRQVLADIAPRTVERLRVHFDDADVHLHDFCRDEPLDAELHLFNGVDTELNDDAWRDVLRRFRERRVLFFPNITFGARVIAGELWCRRPGRRPMRAGWWRTKGRFDELTAPTHDVRRLDGGRAGVAWMLEPKR